MMFFWLVPVLVIAAVVLFILFRGATKSRVTSDRSDAVRPGSEFRKEE